MREDLDMRYGNSEYIDYDKQWDQSSDFRPSANYDVSPFDVSDRGKDHQEEYEILSEDTLEKSVEDSDEEYEVISEDTDAVARVCDGTDDPTVEEYFKDTEQMRELVEPFKPEAWEGLDIDERKHALIEFQRFNNELLGLNPSPDIDFYDNPQEGDYGGYSPGDNAIHINEYMLYDAEEALDTIAHESRHAYQHIRADNPQTSRDFEFAENFENYTSAEDDFEAYQAQIVEADARAYAARYKNYLASV